MVDPINLNNEKFIRRAIEIAQHARDHGNHPFGALLVDENGQILLEAENSVVTGKDSTGHAETNLMRLASAKFYEAYLAKCTVYTSTEPCPMCSGAIFWANVRRVIYGLSEEKFYDLVGSDSEEILHLPCREILDEGNKDIEVVGPILEQEAVKVHAGFW
jgi:tRNA(Arg) A34 adenosine deaminase TadA